MIYLRILLAWALFLGSGAPSFANFAMSPSGTTTAFAIDGSNQGTSLCAAASTECPAAVPINTAGAPLFTSSTPGSISAASGAFASGAFASGSIASGAGVDGWDVTEGAKADTACANSSSTCSISASLKGILGAVQGAIPSGTAMIGYVGLQANTTGGCTFVTEYMTGASTNATNVKGAAGTLCSLTVVQYGTTQGYLRLYDSSSAPTCSNSNSGLPNFPIQSNTAGPGMSPNLGSFGMNFTAGISFCFTGADGNNDNTNWGGTTNQVHVVLGYK